MIAFDLDGTLIDCRARQLAVAVHLAGPGLDADAFWAAKRDGATTRAALEAQGLDGELARAWVAQIEDDAWLAHDALLPGALEALAGTDAFILTARRRAAAVRRQVAALGLVVAVRVVDPGAAAAEQKARVLRATGAQGMVGDSESDARAAQLAGVAFAAVSSGQRSEAYLERHGVAPVHADVSAAVAALTRRP